jgi:hypothetical protein
MDTLSISIFQAKALPLTSILLPHWRSFKFFEGSSDASQSAFPAVLFHLTSTVQVQNWAVLA